ncbi:LysR family transcriptional regulator [Dietzia natronolimnaea]|uniref:LysR family transcriptional regulator n=1 Tax=Dietzia natronolimnaea TaxID=161920 RepID=A0A2A2WLF2_9ACTN|nr:LysR family transcriptional regulator substrate-binding protein [Dietzia natronolimnaea]PAY22039.1 LysR family transcriptional regulator [Dietzia natronolimnaea]
MNDENGPDRRGLAIGYVPGVQPDKWLTRWRERNPGVPITARRMGDPLAGLVPVPGASGVDVVFLREAEDAPRAAPTGLLRIPLYTETMAVLAPRDHELGAYNTLSAADLAGERWLDPVDVISASPDEVSAAVDLVAAGAGLLVLPQPYARSLSRRDIVERPLEGVPATRMGVAWSSRREGDVVIDEFVGIVRGRTAATSRNAGDAPREKLTARQKTAAKARARGGQARGGLSRGEPPRGRRQEPRGKGRSARGR